MKLKAALLLSGLLCNTVFAGEGYYYLSNGLPDPQLASYAFAGFCYAPVPIMDDWDKFVFDSASSSAKPMNEGYFYTLPDEQREKELPLALSGVAKDLKLSFETVTLSKTEKNSFQKNFLKKLSVSPKWVSRVAGGHPYVLVAIVDRYGELAGSGEIEVRTKLDGKTVDYLGHRSVLDRVPKGNPQVLWHRVAAITLVAFSAGDGKLAWQANEAQTEQKLIFNDQKGCARDCLENIFKRLEARWKKTTEQKDGNK